MLICGRFTEYYSIKLAKGSNLLSSQEMLSITALLAEESSNLERRLRQLANYVSAIAMATWKNCSATVFPPRN
jgi:hypothetical protein